MHALSPVQACLEELHRRFAGLSNGQVADYIPELAKAVPSHFAIALATVDGHLYEVGDSRQTFTIQSISKPLVYGAALEDRGAARVQQAIGLEPSGEAFNSISLEAGTGRPLNPMINAGAIAAASLIDGADPAARLERVVSAISAYAGRRLDIDEAVYASERDTGHRNRAIGHLLRNYGIVDGDPEPALDLYFRQCAVRVDCRDLAWIGATLANGGLHPRTGQRALAAEHLRPVLSVMATCGVYDFTGEWTYRVGMPAKSGVGGGIVAVLPGQLGLGVFSPPLDERGNSVRGMKVCEALSAELGLHVLLPPRASADAVRRHYTLAQVRSKRQRPAAEQRLLDAAGGAVAVFELQGDLRFATVEPVLHTVLAAAGGLRHVVLDFKRVSHVDAAATRLLARLVGACAGQDRQIILTRVRRGELLAGFDAEVDPRAGRAVRFEPSLDGALEACERALLAGRGVARAAAPIPLADHALCAGLSPSEVAALEAAGERIRHEPGSAVVRRGEPADALYLVLQGEASVLVTLRTGVVQRLSTLAAGASFGERALDAGGQRSADVRADTPLECLRLGVDAIARLEGERPALVLRLLRNLLAASGAVATRLTAEVAALED